MSTIINSLLQAFGATCIFLVPMLIFGYLDEQLKREAYARMVLNQSIKDAVDNGVGGKVLKHLIETGQL